ncbi:Hypothetical protein CINCED_3A017169 [Cinara cedri]|uniref:Uncharacterized protein n=1 Tax=Cinara cedri TaxID=506608 RepID=A0A5E4M0V3_9HEMI|nr:Hypothetical protein CINCED_3A017169 [Cinara cedri]
MVVKRRHKTVSTVERSKLEAFKMWCYRKIEWTERITNETVLFRIKEKRELWCTIKVGRDVECYIGRRPRMEWYMKQIMIDMRKDNYQELNKLSYKREARENCCKPTKLLKMKRR